MRIRKAFMALNPQGHIVRAENAIPEVHYRCHHCDCPLLLHTEDRRGKPWFEHDAQAFTEDQLRKCAYFDDLSLVEQKMLELQQQLRSIQPVVVVQRWHCIDCNLCYSGVKRCPECGSGIYSVEAQQAEIPEKERALCPPVSSVQIKRDEQNAGDKRNSDAHHRQPQYSKTLRVPDQQPEHAEDD